MTNVLNRDQLTALLNHLHNAPEGIGHLDRAINRLTGQASERGLIACDKCGVFGCDDDDHKMPSYYKITILVAGDHDPSALLDSVQFAVEQGRLVDGLTLDPKAVEDGEAVTVEEL